MLELLSTDARTVAGLMSGTSLDGVDAVIARLRGSGPEMEVHIHGSSHTPYPADLVEVVLKNTHPGSSSVKELTQLHARLGQIYAAAVEEVVASCGLSDDLDLIGSHGQTIYHLPDAESFCGAPVTSTLQLGNISIIANQVGVPVVGDFRSADMALGGEGAPLVPYFDYIYFTHPERTRLVLNIGGIANITFLPAHGTKARVRAFDTGPGNMLIDGLVQRLFDQPFDDGGMHAQRGEVFDPLVDLLLEEDEFLQEAPPKSTGREHYGQEFLDRLIGKSRRMDCTGDDLVATVTAFTARSIYASYERFLAPTNSIDELIVSGGGVHNRVLMEMLADLFAPVPVVTTGAKNLDPDLKEALCFAVLAHEFANGVPTNMPSVTGASGETLLGNLAFPFKKE